MKQWDRCLEICLHVKNYIWDGGIILAMGSANARRHCYVMPSLIGQAHTQNNLWDDTKADDVFQNQLIWISLGNNTICVCLATNTDKHTAKKWWIYQDVSCMPIFNTKELHYQDIVHSVINRVMWTWHWEIHPWSWSALSQVRTCLLSATSCYLIQCWLSARSWLIS